MAKRITSLLLVVLLLAGVVPVALVGSASANEIAAAEPVDTEPESTETVTEPDVTEASTEPELTEESTIPETTEPATESAFTEESIDPSEDSEELEFQFAIDAGVYETYILEHMDSSLVGSGDTLIPYDLLTVKQTLVSGEILDALGGSHTIDGLWTDHNGDGLSDYDDALLIQKGAEVYLYMVSADAPYLVGYVDTLNAPSYRVEDHLFAENTNEGNLLSGCIYDAETGLVYVPVGESLRVDETGKLLIGRVQIQLLYVSSCQEPAAAAFSMAANRSPSSSLFTSSIKLEVIQPDKETSNVRNVPVSFMDTHISLNVDTGGSCIDYVTVNGCPVEQNQWAYSGGTLQIAHQPASAGSVTVVLKDPEDMLSRLYQNFGLTEKTDFSKLQPEDYPVLSDLYDLCIQEYHCYDTKRKPLYTEETLRNICLGLNSVCVGSESRFFNGHTNIQDNMFLVFGVKGVMDLNKKLRCAIEFNILSYMTHQLLSVGNCVAALDELYLFLDSPVTIEYIRNNMKRVRKKDSSMVLASQNIEDFLIPSIREMTKPLFSIPTHQFLFNPGQINPRDYMDALQVEQAEYDLIHSCERGHNLYRCGNERYLLQVIAPEHKAALFGNAGGR